MSLLLCDLGSMAVVVFLSQHAFFVFLPVDPILT